MAAEQIATLSLDKRVMQQLQDLYQQQESEGELPSKQQLEQYYAAFRNKFGPEQLARLDGEALLETMHSHGTKDSLVYWLEFKDDEEFPVSLFGSIAGGSAHKFGLFRKKETGKWTTGSPQKPVEISVEQAIEIARQHRDELIRGAELLDRLPNNGNDEYYARLQQDMQRVAPSVSNTAWGHKYFALLYPDKLDDFHNPDYARFHLIKLLQLPPQAEGRYVMAGRFVTIAHALDIPLHILTKLMNERDGRTLHSYWRIGTTEGKLTIWPEMRDGSFVSIGWNEVGDLSSATKDEIGKQAIRALVETHYPDKNAPVVGNTTRQIVDFRWNIAIGDLVLASDGASVLGIGRVTGEYTYDPSGSFVHRRPVEWLSLEEWKQPDQKPDIEGKLTTIYRMKRPLNLIEAEKHILDGLSMQTSEPLPGSPPSGPGMPPRPLPRLTGLMERIQAVLERKGQVILYGPPGTGKTYWAEQTAHELAARARFRTSFNALNSEQRAMILGDGKTLYGNIRICCFHPDYGYEDFLEGLRPKVENGQMHFEPRDGIFKQLCRDAIAYEDQPFYLIIDEINRGDIPRIFGELLMVLEKDKRGKPILLPLTSQLFRVPKNIFIIGTMNTADRSIALLDTALRRRFGFIELMPDSEPLKKAMVGRIPLGAWLESLNSRIREHVGRDARNLQIGHAYLMKQGLPIADFATFARVVQEDILPLLEEYCYEDYHRLEQILGTGLVDAKAQTIHHELFDLSQQDNLVQALIQPCPEITTTNQAAAAEAQQEMMSKEEEEHDESEGRGPEA
jgi:5-methylcytosine-specific restriction enzyme B